MVSAQSSIAVLRRRCRCVTTPRLFKSGSSSRSSSTSSCCFGSRQNESFLRTSSTKCCQVSSLSSATTSLLLLNHSERQQQRRFHSSFSLKKDNDNNINNNNNINSNSNNHEDNNNNHPSTQGYGRVWRSDDIYSRLQKGEDEARSFQKIWKNRVIDDNRKENRDFNLLSKEEKASRIDDLVEEIQEKQGGEMRQRQLGVLHADPAVDLQLLTDNYTVKAVASALRDREDALQQAALLAEEEKYSELKQFLQIFHPKYVQSRRQQRNPQSIQALIDPSDDDDNKKPIIVKRDKTDPVLSLQYPESRNVIRKTLMRMPRTVTTAHSKRAGVCLALCISNGVPSILLEKRAHHMRNFPNEVCFPGGMVCDIQDQTIVSTSIREMKEEIGGLEYAPENIEVLGILRLNWGEVQYLTGVAVTPVVCYLGPLPDELYPNPDEVSEVFTIPLRDLLNRKLWVHREGLAPIFVGGPHVIFGLTGYILERLAKDILLPTTTSSTITTSTTTPQDDEDAFIDTRMNQYDNKNK